MSCSWERRLADNLTNADHMRDLRQRIDTEHEERLRRRQREREDAEVRRAARKVRSPTASDNKFKTRSYDRPWAMRKTDTRKTASSRSDSSNTSSRNSGSRLPEITNRAQGQLSETRTPLSTKQKKHNKHPGNNSLIEDDSLSANKDRCVRTKTRKSIPSASSTCYQGDHFQYPVSQGKPPLTHSRESAPMPQERRLPRAWPRLPSLRSTFSWTSSELDIDRQSLQESWDISDTDHNTSGSESSIPEEVEEIDDSNSSSSFSARSVSTDSWLSSVKPADTPLSTPMSSSISSSSSSTISTSMSYRSSLLDLTPRARPSPLDALVRDVPCLEPITSESDEEEEEEELEEELSNWQTGPLGRGTVRWRGPLSRPYLVPLPTASIAAAVASSRGGAAESQRWDVSPRHAASDEDIYGTMPSLEPIPDITPAAAASLSTLASATRNHHRSHQRPNIMDGPPSLEPVPRNVPPWLARLSTPVASPVLQAGGAQNVGESGTSSPSQSQAAPSRPGGLASRMEALALMDQLGIALVAMREMRREIQGIQRRNRHGNNRNDDTETGNDSGNGNDSNRENSTSVDGNTASVPEAKPQADPETLRRITQSLLEESDDEGEEGEQCRICQCGPGTLTNPLLSPCRCSGSLQYIHHDCLKKWIETKIESGADMPAVTTCELCKATLKLDLKDFDLEECFRRNAEAQRELGSPDLHLLLLLQERFSGLMMAIQAHNAATAQELRQRTERGTEVDSPLRTGQGTVTTTRGWTSSDSDF